ncbi:MAG: hypothetical protein HOG49_12985 [Candidatus Scalindua sp.]|jgi:hypothetical protein|nr:hypothetical protein [Candidatus Scalindua sp.]
MKNPKYIVRPDDSYIWELDESNNCYRSYKPIKYSDGTRANAHDNYTFKRLTEIYDFFPIEEDELAKYEAKCKDHYAFVGWQIRSDGHGGCKGGTRAEYEIYLERVERYQKWKKEEGIE